MAENELYRDERGVLRDEDGYVVSCSWYAMCSNPATEVESHPILGGVPVCERCAGIISRMKAELAKQVSE